MHYRYYGKGMHMSADLRAVFKRVRANRPEMFAAKTVVETSMDGEGKVTRSERQDVKAIAPSPQRRHELSNERY